MSKRVIGYEGEGRARRPIYADEGPSAASTGDGLASVSRLGRLSALDIRETAGQIEFDNTVERRQITAAERAARDQEARPSPIEPRRAAARPPRVQEEPNVTGTPPVEPEAEPSASPFTRLAQAAQDAAAAKAAKDVADRAWEVAQAALEAAWREVKGTDDPASLDAAGVVRPKPARVPHRRPNTAQESRANGTAAMLAKRKPEGANGAAPKADLATGGGSGKARPAAAADPRRDRQAPRRSQGCSRRDRDQRQQRHDRPASARQEGLPARRSDRRAPGRVREVFGRLS